VPGAWCNPENLNCATYFAYFGKYLLNQQYALIPGVEAIRMADWLFSVFGKGGEVFVRPAGCHKLFVGRQVSRDLFAEGLASTRFDPTTLIVIAAPKLIDREWRVVVAGNKVIAASQYAVGGIKSVAPGCPAAVQSFAENMLAAVAWRPDPIFMLDVCESNGKLWLVEINGFSCSWLYQCDLPSVVARVGELACKSWEDANKNQS
jgi:hypothetical protein